MSVWTLYIQVKNKSRSDGLKAVTVKEQMSLSPCGIQYMSLYVRLQLRNTVTHRITAGNNTYYSGFMIAEVAPVDTTKWKVPEIESWSWKQII